MLKKMNWITVYITGKPDFRDEVRRKLRHSELAFMPGYSDSPGPIVHDLYWIEEHTDIRVLKKAIGSKLIWKYRLRFYSSLEKFIESQHSNRDANRFTDEELALISKVRGKKVDV